MCPQPSAREANLPFTGKWQRQGGDRVLCLYQSAPDRVTGNIDGKAVAGRIEPDGALFLAVSENGRVELYRGSLLNDTLTVESLVQSGTQAGPIIGVGKLIRRPLPGNSES